MLHVTLGMLFENFVPSIPQISRWTYQIKKSYLLNLYSNYFSEVQLKYYLGQKIDQSLAHSDPQHLSKLHYVYQEKYEKIIKEMYRIY